MQLKNKKVVGACKALTRVSAALPILGGTCGWIWLLFWHFHRIIGSSRRPLPPCRTHVRWFGAVWLEMAFLFFFPSLSSWICVQAMSKSKLALQLFFFSIQSLFFYLQFFYLHWLFIIGFYFLFHPWSFDF
jgi:hypothetical protein